MGEQMTLGHIAAYFESGNTERSVKTISYNPQDPGGKSYGKYQLAARTGTLKRYIAWSRFNNEFKDTPLASTAFDEVWLRLADNPEFEKEQQEFIELTHFKPVQNYAASLGYDITNDAINEALFSIGVQHGGFKKILSYAAGFRKEAVPNVEEDIINLYKARAQYITNLALSNKMKEALRNRYKKEVEMVLAINKDLNASDPAPYSYEDDTELEKHTEA